MAPLGDPLRRKNSNMPQYRTETDSLDSLELNAFGPLIADVLLGSLGLLTGVQFDELVSPQRVMRLGSDPKPDSTET